MTEFRTTFNIPSSSVGISYADQILLMGSCFVENIGKRLTRHKFNSLNNPFGTLYNPASIAKGLERLLEEKLIKKNELFDQDGLWHNFNFHSRFSGVDPDDVLDQMNQSIKKGHQQLLKSRLLILTPGTAWIYKHKRSGVIVANNHKLPHQEFERSRLTPAEIVSYFKNSLQPLRDKKEDLQVIFTISPIRHLKDGMVENARSKASLVLGVEALVSEYSWMHYFPAYELMLDDLRDYRFYAENMTHPNETAVSYIWDRFTALYFDTVSRERMNEIAGIMRSLDHRARHPGTGKDRQFLNGLKEKVRKLEKEMPDTDWQKEKEALDLRYRDYSDAFSGSA